MRTWTSIATAALVATTACVDAPSAPATTADDNVLASSLDALSKEAAQEGDAERSQEFLWASIAVRGGVTPSKLQIKTGGTLETFEAMVHAVTWVVPTAAQRAPNHRTLLAWRRAGSSLQTLVISATADSSPVQNPLSLSVAPPLAAPFAGAHVLYSVRGDRPGNWFGISGKVKMAEGSMGNRCVPVTGDKKSPNGVTCQQVTYTVGFEMTLQSDVPAPLAAAAILHMGANDQPVSGAKLVFACSNPNRLGC